MQKLNEYLTSKGWKKDLTETASDAKYLCFVFKETKIHMNLRGLSYEEKNTQAADFMKPQREQRINWDTFAKLEMRITIPRRVPSLETAYEEK